MLPLHPELKIKIEQLLIDIAQQAAQSRLGLFAGTPRVRQHEGNRLEYMTIDGDEKATDYRRIEVGTEIRPSDIPTMTFNQAVQLVVNKGIELGTQEAGFYFEVLNESIAEVGNAIDVGGQPFNVDLLLQMLERMQFPFDGYGNPHLPTLHIGPDLEESVKRVLEEADKDADAQARLKAIIDKKREEWNAQQDRRKLVD
jgi:hypothetical protein